MAWYSSINGIAAKLSPVPSLTRADGFAATDYADGNNEGITRLSSSEMPHTALDGTPSSHFFKPSGIDWAPTEADRVYVAFDTSQPVARPADLRGRDAELARLLSGVLHRRNHGVISGTRGSGKTSLVRVFGQYADRQGVVVLYAACDAGTTFGELLRDFLEQVPASSVDADEVEILRQRVGNFGPDSSPHQATSILAQVKYSQVIFIVDEFDRVSDQQMQSKVASLLKLVSDARLQMRFVLVGGASAFTDIFSQHPSLVRHITRLSTAPLTNTAIYDVLDSCAERCDMNFSEPAKLILEQVSCGSPYHARLFGMHAALAALRSDATQIDDNAVLAGLAESFEEWASLNQEDATTFRSIVSGAHGDPATFVKIACELASVDDGWKGNSESGHDLILSGFGTAVERIEDRIAFRDATAPQFLLALQKLLPVSKSAYRSRGRADV